MSTAIYDEPRRPGSSAARPASRTRWLTGLARGDLRSISRDSFLGFLIFYPLVLTLILRLLLPIASQRLVDRIDLPSYYSLIVGYQYVLMTPMMFGVVVGLMLLDEKDERTLTALRVTPLSPSAYLSYRLIAPYVLAVLYALLLVWAIGLHAGPMLPVVPVAIVVALEAPIFALFLSAFANNKVEGLAFMKGVGIFLVAPLIDWFVDASWTLALGIFPTYWPVKAYWLASAGELDGRYWLHLAIGLVYHLLLLAWLMRRFNRSVLR